MVGGDIMNVAGEQQDEMDGLQGLAYFALVAKAALLIGLWIAAAI
jgi:hypothetical protein